MAWSKRIPWVDRDARTQYALGVSDGINGCKGRYSDQHYQRGYRIGQDRRVKAGLPRIRASERDK